MTAALSVPAFLLDEDAIEADELATYIGRALSNAAPGSVADVDVIASDLLRRQGEEEQQIAQLADAKAREIAVATARISMRYDTQIVRHQSRAEDYARAVTSIAEMVDWSTQKKKSRLVGYGSYGVRTKPEAVKIIDPDKALAFARAHCPGAVQEKITYSVIHKAIAPVVAAFIKTHEGIVPDGFDHEAARDVPFAKPELA